MVTEFFPPVFYCLVRIDALYTAIGPLFLGPLSEIFGRSRVLQGANLWYLGANSFAGTIADE